MAALMSAAEPVTAGYATLLLSGVSPDELALLHVDDFGPDGDRIRIAGASGRELSLGASGVQRVAPLLADLGGGQQAVSVAELDRSLVSAARETQLPDADSINALALWHTYVLFLVRQGIDAYALARRAGAIPPNVHAALTHFAPAGGTRPLDSIAFTYPALAA